MSKIETNFEWLGPQLATTDLYHYPTIDFVDKKGQSSLVGALEVARDRLGAKDTADLIALIKGGGDLIG